MRRTTRTLALLALVAWGGPGGGAARSQTPAVPPAHATGTVSDYRPDRAALNLRGPVREVREDAFNLHDGGRTVLFTGNMTLRFDGRGRLVQLLRGNNHMPDLFDERFSYRADGRLAAMERVSNGAPASRDVYVYDDARRRVEVLTYMTDGALVMRVAKAFDERGGETRSEYKFFSAGGEPAPSGQVAESEHAYDGQGRHTGMTVKGPDGRPLAVVARRREPDGRLVVETEYLMGGARGAKSVATYDARGQELSTETFDAGGALAAKTTYERKYDARGNWVEEVIRSRERRGGAEHESSFLRRRTITYDGGAPPAPAGAARRR